jgi:hypothetical protein
VLNPRVRGALVALAASAGLAACTNFGPYGGLGVGIGSPYGYGSSYGYGYGNPYYGSYYGGFPYFGWYDGFYYPGGGYWVYDPIGNPHPITDNQRSYWAGILEKVRQARGLDTTTALKQDFSGFRAKAKAGATISGVDLAAHERSARQLNETRRQARIERQQVQSERQQVRSERQQARSERQESMRQATIERREARRATKSTDE